MTLFPAVADKKLSASLQYWYTTRRILIVFGAMLYLEYNIFRKKDFINISKRINVFMSENLAWCFYSTWKRILHLLHHEKKNWRLQRAVAVH